jgi:hypothetical protein
MPYLKCAPCRIRLDRAGPEAELFEGFCPICGMALEPASQLAELVGFRSFDLADGERAFATPSEKRNESVRHVRDAMTTRDAALAQARLDAGRWLDEGGSFSSDAMAQRFRPADS